MDTKDAEYLVSELKKLEISIEQDWERILEQLDEKHSEYLDRLDLAANDERTKNLELTIENIEDLKERVTVMIKNVQTGISLESADSHSIKEKKDYKKSIDKLKEGNKNASSTIPAMVLSNSTVNPQVEAQIMQGYDCLLYKEWDKADQIFENVIMLEPRNAKAFAGKVLAKYNLSKEEELKQCDFDYQSDVNFIKACDFADLSYREVLMGYVIYKNNFLAYKEAYREMQSARLKADYKNAALLFDNIAPFKDAKYKAYECREKVRIMEQIEIRREEERKNREERNLEIKRNVSKFWDYDKELASTKETSKIEGIKSQINFLRTLDPNAYVSWEQEKWKEKNRLRELAKKEEERVIEQNRKQEELRRQTNYARGAGIPINISAIFLAISMLFWIGSWPETEYDIPDFSLQSTVINEVMGKALVYIPVQILGLTYGDVGEILNKSSASTVIISPLSKEEDIHIDNDIENIYLSKSIKSITLSDPKKNLKIHSRGEIERAYIQGMNNTGFISVKLPDSIKSLSLNNVYLEKFPKNLQEIYLLNSSETDAIDKITLPDGVRNVEISGQFNNVETIEVPGSVEILKIDGNKHIKELIIPKNSQMKSLKINDCENLKTVTYIPESLTELLLTNLDSLENLTIPENNKIKTLTQ